MNEFIIYLVKSGLCISIFLLIYRLFLYATTFFEFNRFYLLTGLIISLIIPAFDYTYEVLEVTFPTVTSTELAFNSPALSKVSEVKVRYIEDTALVIPQAEDVFLIKMENIWMAVFILYISVVVLLILRNIIANFYLYKLYRRGNKTTHGKYILVDTKEVDSPFTLFNIIFADMSKISEEFREYILKHEIIHITQKHWADLIISEFILISQWFNPVVWLYVRYQKENHEYLADKGVIDSGVSAARYRAVLVNERLQSNVINFASAFKNSDSLGRLAMMKKEKTSSWKKVLALTILPVFGVFFWVSATPNYIMLNVNELNFRVISGINVVDEEGNIIENGVNPKDLLYLSQLPGYANTYLKLLRDADKVMSHYFKVGKDGTLVIETQSSNTYKIRNTEILDTALQLEDVVIIIDGVSSPDEDLHDIDKSNISSLTYMYDNRMIMQTEENMTVTFLPGYEDNNPKFIRTDNFQIAQSSDIYTSIEQLEDALIIINGKASNINKLKKIKPESIYTLSVFTKSKSIAKYGNRGKNGVVLISTRNPS